MIVNHDEKHPFPGARTMIESPIDTNAFRPKVWNTDGWSVKATGWFHSPSSEFFAEGLAPGDPIFIISGTPAITLASTVAGNIQDHRFDINWMADQDYTNMVFKVGEAALHTFDTLINIVRDRGVAPFTIHFARLWVDARFRDFNRDETGDVYCIDPEEEAKLGGKNRVNGHLEARPVLPPIPP